MRCPMSWLSALCLAALVLTAAAQRQITSGSGGPCSLKPNGVTCNSDATCADWVNGGTCCVGAFQTKLGDYCNVANGVCCMDSLTCSGNKCVKAGPPPCKTFAPLNSFCDLAQGKCCGGNKVSCTAGKCVSPYPPAKPANTAAVVLVAVGNKPPVVNKPPVANKPPACSKYAGIGDSCDLARGFCCGGNRVSCTSGRCISPYPTSTPAPSKPANTPSKPANTAAVVLVAVKPAATNKPPACSKYAGIGDSCDLARGFCCGGNKISCTKGRCISPYPTSTPAPVNKPVACTKYAGIGDSCDLARGFCCGGNRISCTSGRCISPYPTTGHKLA